MGGIARVHPEATHAGPQAKTPSKEPALGSSGSGSWGSFSDRGLPSKKEVLLYAAKHKEALFVPQLSAKEAAIPGNGLYMDKDHWLRRTAIRLVMWKWFDFCMILVIMVNCITLAMDSNRPGFKSTSTAQTLNVVNFVILGLFTIEMIVKMIALGLILEPGSYFRSGWNVMDFIIVTTGYLAFGPLSNYTALRALRVLRPLRAVNKLEEMRILISTFLGSMPLLSNVFYLVLFYFLMFGVVCLYLFSGRLEKRCTAPDFSGAYSVLGSDGATWLLNVTYPNPVLLNEAPDSYQDSVCKGPNAGDIIWLNNSVDVGNEAVFTTDGNGNAILPVATNIELVSAGHVCVHKEGAHPYGLFCAPYGNPGIGGWRSCDNILLSFILVFQHVTLADYVFIMYDTQNGVNWWTWILHFTMAILGAYMLASLVLAVLFLYFSKNTEMVREKHEHEHDNKGGGEETLMSAQSRIINTEFVSRQYSGHFDDKPGKWAHFRQQVFEFQSSKGFTTCSMGVIIMNGIVLGLIWYDMPHKLLLATTYVNWACTVYFVVELLVRLLGLGFAQYFSDQMNTFDAVVTVACLADLIVAVVPNVTSKLSGALTALRLLRLLRVARFWKSLYLVIITVIRSFKSVLYLSLLLILLMFITGLLGMNIYGYKLAFCNRVADSEQLCPPGLKFDECPYHFDCYVSCDASLDGTWFSMTGSPYGEQAYCEQFPRNLTNGSALKAGTVLTHWAQVGQPLLPFASFDDIFESMVTIFQLMTLDNWPGVMQLYQTAVSPWSAIFFVLIITVTSFIMLSLFLAILLDNLEQLELNYGNTENKVNSSKAAVFPNPPSDQKSAPCNLDLDQCGRTKLDAAASATNCDGLEESSRKSKRHSPDDTVMLSNTSTSASNSADDGLPQSPTATRHASAPGANIADADISLPPPAAGHVSAPVRTSVNDVLPQLSRQLSQQPSATLRYSTITSVLGLQEAHDHTVCMTMRALALTSRRVLPVTPGLHPRSSFTGISGQTFGDGRYSGVSLFIFGPSNKIRGVCATISESRWYQWSMVLLIIASCVALALDSVTIDRESQLGRALLVMDIIFATMFCLECALKIIAQGFAFCGRGSYIFNRWNQLDLFIALLSVTVLMVEFTVRERFMWLNAIRALRGLRLLRVASLHEGVCVVVTSSVAMLPAISHVLMVGFLLYYMFAVLAVNLFMGKMFYCTNSAGVDFNGPMMDAYYYLPYRQTINKSWCEANSGAQVVTSSWYHSQINVSVPAWNDTTEWHGVETRFDNVFMAIWTLFSMASAEGWSDIMHLTAAIVDVDQNLMQNNNMWMELFSIAFMIVGSFLMLNLLAGVAINAFKKMKEKNDGAAVLLSEGQNEWLTTQKMVAGSNLRTKYVPPENPVRLLVFIVIFHPITEWIVLFLIIANIIILCLYHTDQGPEWESALEMSNFVFTAIFTVEVVLKWIAVGVRRYFADPWNRFDFIVVALAVIGVILGRVGFAGSTLFSVLRALRVIRLFRLVPKLRKVQMMVQAMLWSAPALGNLSAVLFVYMFIYAIVGMNLFGNIGPSPNLTSITNNCNFQSFPSSMLLLFRCMTGENWNAIMVDAMNQQLCLLVTKDQTVTLEDGTTQAVHAGTFLDPTKDAMVISELDDYNDMCSIAPALSIIYFCSYMLVVSFLVLQLVIGLLLESMSLISYLEDVTIGQTLIHKYIEIWENIDTGATGYIPTSRLPTQLLKLPPPLGVKGLPYQHRLIQDILNEIDLPNRPGNQVHFLETLHALSGRIIGVVLPTEYEAVVHSKLISQLPHGAVPKYTASNYYDAMKVTGAIRGFIQRKKMQDELHASQQKASTLAMPNTLNLLRGETLMALRGDNVLVLEQVLGASAQQRDVRRTAVEPFFRGLQSPAGSPSSRPEGTHSGPPTGRTQLPVPRTHATAYLLNAHSPTDPSPQTFVEELPMSAPISSPIRSLRPTPTGEGIECSNRVQGGSVGLLLSRAATACSDSSLQGGSPRGGSLQGGSLQGGSLQGGSLQGGSPRGDSPQSISGQVRSGQVSSGQVRSGQVSSGQVRSGQVSSGQVSSGQVNSGQVSSGQVSSGQVSSGQVNSGQVSSGQVSSGQVSSGQVNSGQVSSGQVNSGQVSSRQVRSGQVSSGQVSSGQIGSGQYNSHQDSIPMVVDDGGLAGDGERNVSASTAVGDDSIPRDMDEAGEVGGGSDAGVNGDVVEVHSSGGSGCRIPAHLESPSPIGPVSNVCRGNPGAAAEQHTACTSGEGS